MVRIVFSVPVLPPRLEQGGGCALRYYSMMMKFLKEGNMILLFTAVSQEELIHFSKGKLTPYIIGKQIQIITLKSISTTFYREISIPEISFRNTNLLYKNLVKFKPQLFITHDSSDTTITMLLARLTGVPCILYGIDTDLNTAVRARPIATWLKNVFSFFLFLCVFVSNLLSTHTIMASKAFQDEVKNTWIYKYIRVDSAYKPILWSDDFFHDPTGRKEQRHYMTKGNEDKPLCLYAGRWSMEKRIEKLVDSIPSDWNLVIVGNGPDEDSLKIENLASHHPNVYTFRNFFGSKQLSKMYNAADFLVSASNFETYGFVAKEALSCGTPVCVENAGGFKETVVHTKNGLLVNFDDTNKTKQTLLRYEPSTENYKQMKNYVLENESQVNVENYTFSFLSTHAKDILFKTYKISVFRWLYIFPLSLVFIVMQVLQFFTKVS